MREDGEREKRKGERKEKEGKTEFRNSHPVNDAC